jgi:hypothetical protein
MLPWVVNASALLARKARVRRKEAVIVIIWVE